MSHQESIPAVDIKEFLRRLFMGVAEEDLDELVQASFVSSFSTEELIFREGEPGDAFYAVIDGQIEIFKELQDGNERHLLSSGSGKVFGEMALLQEGGRNASVRALQPTTLLGIKRDSFLAVLGRSPSLGIRIMLRLTDRLRDSDQQAITELRKANEELRRALDQLERLDRTKSDFIRVQAHELRTPVAALLGYAQMLRTMGPAQEDAAVKSLIEGVVTSTERLHRIFNSILDLSRIMTGDLEVQRSPVSIPVIFQGIYSEFKEAMKERNLTYTEEGLNDLPFCLAEPDLLYKALYHLVNNAIKYTPDGGTVSIIGRTVEADELGLCLEVVIQDTGIGIAADDIELIFEKFYRTGEVALHSSGKTSFKGGGPGLGLAITQGVIVAHGGRIWAESPGCDESTCPGSRFIVQIPLSTAANPSIGAEEKPDLYG